MSELNQLRMQFIREIKAQRAYMELMERDGAVKPPEPQLFTKRMGDRPEEYRYGGENAAIALYLEGGYPTPEEAVAAWEKEQENT